MVDDNKGGYVCILEDFTLCSLDLVKEVAARMWSKLDHINVDVFTYRQKVSFDPANDSNDKRKLSGYNLK